MIEQRREMDIIKQPFGQTDDMTLVDLYRLTNLIGMEVRITNYGATLVAVTVADRNGNQEDIILGYDSLADYINGSNYFGCIAGRYANRIAGGRFKLNETAYLLAQNEAHGKAMKEIGGRPLSEIIHLSNGIAKDKEKSNPFSERMNSDGY